MQVEADRALINGVTLSWRETGSGDDVLVLLHGFPFSSAIWRPQLEYPPAGWRVIAPDLRGFGGSGQLPPARFTMDQFADDVIALLQHLGVRSAIVCGHSMGGYITFALMRRAHAMLRGLVLTDTRPAADTADAKKGRLKNAKHVQAHGTAALVDALVPRLISDATRENLPHVEQELRSIMGAAPASSVVAALVGMAERPDSTAQLRSINVPALIVVGEHDVITPAGEARLLARAVPGAQIEVIAGAGHIPSLEQPAAFNRILEGFVRGI